MTDRIEDALRNLGAEHNPPPGWQDRVFARLRRPAVIDAIAKVVALVMVLWVEVLAAVIAALWLWGVL